jgi:hypothetical protein
MKITDIPVDNSAVTYSQIQAQNPFFIGMSRKCNRCGVEHCVVDMAFQDMIFTFLRMPRQEVLTKHEPRNLDSYVVEVIPRSFKIATDCFPRVYGYLNDICYAGYSGITKKVTYYFDDDFIDAAPEKRAENIEKVVADWRDTPEFVLINHGIFLK